MDKIDVEDSEKSVQRWDVKNNPLCLRVIKTARDINSINGHVKNGYIPLIRKASCNPEIGWYINIYQNNETGEFVERNQYCEVENRDGFDIENHEKIFENIHHYPHNFKSSYGAYLIPNDLFIGQQVFIEDLIEDFVGAYTITYRGKTVERAVSCHAIWNGKDLEISTPKENGVRIY